jgi:PAS domain S-box-containing protein
MNYQRLLNALPGMAFQFRLNAQQEPEFLFCSEGSFPLYGLTAPQILTTPKLFFDCFSPAQLLTLKESLIFCAAQQIDWNLELTLVIQGKNRVHHFYASPLCEADGSVSWSGMILDITQQYAEQDSHLKNERLLSSLFDLSPLAIALVNANNGRFIKTNIALQRLLGYTETELAALGPEDLLDPVGLDDFQRQKLILQHQLRFEPHETVFRTQSGASIEVLNNGMLLVDPAAPPAYWLIIEDISERKLFERQLMEQKHRAEVAAVAKSNFLASMSHEIRTPLNGVLGMLDVLQQSQITSEQKRQIDIALNSGAALLELLNNLLDFSKMDAGKLELAMTTVNIQQLLEEAYSPFAYIAREKQLDFSCSFQADTAPWIKTDVLRLKQILNNLLSNALKFTHVGGIQASASLQSQQGVTLLSIEIKDTGIGISEEQSAAIFDPFTQADSSTTRQYGGTGLGLAICQQLSQLLGGGIHVQSTPEQGSCFSLWLCVELADPEEVLAPWPAESSELPAQCRILLVDDNPVNCEVVRLMLNNMGAEVHMANHGLEAITCLKAQASAKPFHLILMDCMMPQMDGYQATAAIRLGQAGQRYQQIPIVALTANAMAGDKEKCFIAGMTGYLSKPVTQQSLVKEIAKVLKSDNILLSSEADNPDADLSEPVEPITLANQAAWWDRDAFLKSLGSMASMDVELLSAFVESLRKHQMNFHLAQQQQDIPKIQLISHSIKGSAGQVCCYPLSEAAQALNLSAKQLDWSLLQNQFATFENVLTITISSFEQFLNQTNNDRER